MSAFFKTVKNSIIGDETTPKYDLHKKSTMWDILEKYPNMIPFFLIILGISILIFIFAIATITATPSVEMVI